MQWIKCNNMKFKINIKSLHLSLNTFEEELAGRKSGSAICVKSLVVTYMLNLSQQYAMAAKKANVLLVCADRRTKTRMRPVSGSLARLSSSQIVCGVGLVWCTTL